MIGDAHLWMPFAGSMVAFLASHAIPARPSVRRRLVRVVGERLYIALYSAMSLFLLGWLFRSAGEAPYVELWPAMDWQRLVPRVVVPAAFALGSIGLFTANPLSLSANRWEADDDAAGILGVTRHPVLWALALWAAAHMVPNGDVAHVVLFGTLLALCLAGMAMMDRRATKRLGPSRWNELAARRPLMPFSDPRSLNWPSPRDVVLCLVGLSLARCAAVLHEATVGVPAV
jgi:uncharacterized membrane protein